MYKKEPGYIKILEIKDIAFHIHWSFPVGGLFIAWFFNQTADRYVYFIAAYVILVLVHGLGHVLAALMFRLKVQAITISGGGGMCYSEKPKTYKEAFLLIGGGVIAQVILFSVTVIYIMVFGYPSSSIGNAFIITFLAVNLIMFLINIIPSKFKNGIENDGFKLWSLAKSYYGKA